MKLTEISKEEFDNLPVSKKILCSEEYPRKFAVLSIKDNLESIALCWQSEFVKPQIIDDNATPLLWFGIDQQIIAINKHNGKLALMLKLETNLFQIIMSENSVVLRTELEIFSFSLSGIIQFVHSLPEISESISIKNSTATVSLIDGESITLKV